MEFHATYPLLINANGSDRIPESALVKFSTLFDSTLSMNAGRNLIRGDSGVLSYPIASVRHGHSHWTLSMPTAKGAGADFWLSRSLNNGFSYDHGISGAALNLEGMYVKGFGFGVRCVL